MYEKSPFVPVGTQDECLTGWEAILSTLDAATPGQIVMECYPGVLIEEIASAISRELPERPVFRSGDAMLPCGDVEARFADWLTEDPIFGRMNNAELQDFFAPASMKLLREQISAIPNAIVLGTGASLVCSEGALLIYADLTRWEIQHRQRCDLIPNLGLDNFTERAALKYKRAFFLDWRAADRAKLPLLGQLEFLLDTNVPGAPRMISGDSFRAALASCVSRPFRVVPFFDPGPWGGHWMERVCDLPEDGAPNHAWCFDCVPEENTLLLGFGEERVQIPALDIVLQHPRELLGESVYDRFGAEFPIRFDLLDTVGGGNLSLQVHPMKEYIREHFGMNYTQDESYYMLDAEPEAVVYLGLKTGVDRERMTRDLSRAQDGSFDFPADEYVNKFPARKHDHFLIPAGTIHCSGAGSMVLEISATPYIFTFKLWDWGRLGLDGQPRPIHIDHGLQNMQWTRTTDWVRHSLVNQFEPLGSGEGWREERTGLHQLEFIETRRHWFTGVVPHDTCGTVHVLNLVEGEEAIVESITQAFPPFIVHYAETFIVPAAVGPYAVRPYGRATGHQCATMLAYVRPQT